MPIEITEEQKYLLDIAACTSLVSSFGLFIDNGFIERQYNKELRIYLRSSLKEMKDRLHKEYNAITR